MYTVRLTSSIMRVLVALSALTEPIADQNRHTLPQPAHTIHTLVLNRAVPLAVLPLLIEEKLVKAVCRSETQTGTNIQPTQLVGKRGRRERPGAIETAPVLVAATESVCTNQSDNLLVIETLRDGQNDPTFVCP
jgi:hypothetical protein